MSEIHFGDALLSIGHGILGQSKRRTVSWPPMGIHGLSEEHVEK